MSSPENSASGSNPAIAQRIPASFIAIVMGLGGLGHAGRGFPVLVPFGEALVLLAAMLWMLLGWGLFLAVVLDRHRRLTHCRRPGKVRATGGAMTIRVPECGKDSIAS